MRNNHRRVNAPRPLAGRWPFMVRIGMGLLTWSLLASGLASAQAISSCPIVINQPGAYIVTQNLTCPTSAPSQVAISINASNVSLDLLSHTVSGGGGPGHGIVVGPVTGIVIVNGTITGFGGYGLALDRTINTTVSRMAVTQTGGTGILAWGVHNVVISASTVTGPTYGGILVGNGSSGVTISQCLVTNTRGYGGIVVANSTGNLISFNRATGNIAVTQTGDIALDAYDSSPTCAGNTWFINSFSAVIPDCTR